VHTGPGQRGLAFRLQQEGLSMCIMSAVLGDGKGAHGIRSLVVQQMCSSCNVCHHHPFRHKHLMAGWDAACTCRARTAAQPTLTFSKLVCTPVLGWLSPLGSPPLPQWRWKPDAPALANANSASATQKAPAYVSLRPTRPPPYLRAEEKQARHVFRCEGFVMLDIALQSPTQGQSAAQRTIKRSKSQSKLTGCSSR
jgi:hypothetical protein